MTIDPEEIFRWLNGLYGVPKVVLVFILCIAFGWMMKKSPWIPNQRIAFYVCLIGALFLPLLSDFKASDIQSVRVFIATNLTIGFITGAAATLAYRLVIKRILAKFGDGNGDNSDPPFPLPDGSNVADPKERIVNPPTLPKV